MLPPGQGHTTVHIGATALELFADADRYWSLLGVSVVSYGVPLPGQRGALVRRCWSTPIARRISRLLSGLRTARLVRVYSSLAVAAPVIAS